MKGLVGLDITTVDTAGACKDCIYRKHVCRLFDEIVSHKTEVLERIHLDLWGQARTRSCGSKFYTMLLTDGHTGCKDVFILSNKKSAITLEAFQSGTMSQPCVILGSLLLKHSQSINLISPIYVFLVAFLLDCEWTVTFSHL
jgi:hypothetical protein